MWFDQLAIREAKRKAFNALSKQVLESHVVQHHSEGEGHAKMTMHKKHAKNPFYIEPDLISGPGKLVVELPYNNNTNSYNFDFSLNGPKQVPSSTSIAPIVAGTNNINLPQNNIFAIYAIQLWLGYQQPDSTGNNTAQVCIYRSYGITPNDEAIYQSRLKMQIESNTLVDLWDGELFKERVTTTADMWPEAGMVLVDPVRILTGKLGVFTFNVSTLSTMSNIILSGSNIVLSMRLWGMNGQKAGF